MINDKKVIGIIPARGGSKGLPGKNIRPLCGKPLIAWSIEIGKESRYIDTLVVTTDSEEIAIIAKDYRAEVPFLRASELATDEAKSGSNEHADKQVLREQGLPAETDSSRKAGA